MQWNNLIEIILSFGQFLRISNLKEYAGREYAGREGMEYITVNGQTVLSLKAMSDSGNAHRISEDFVELAKKDKEFIEWATRFFSE